MGLRCPVTRFMPYDGIFAAAVVAELHRELAGARIDKIFQPTPDTVLIHCRKPGDTVKLLLSAHPRHARVHLTATRPPNPLHAPVFAMTLRKHLDPGRIAAVKQQGLDRIITFYIDAFDEVGRPLRRLLVAELTGRNSNIVLVDEASGVIVDALRRVNARTNLYRALLPGETYIPPPSGDKVDPRPLSVEDMTRMLVSAAAEEGGGEKPPWDKLLPTLFDGVSPFAAREAILRGGGSEPQQVAEGLHHIVGDVRDDRFTPTARRDRNGSADVWAFAPLQWPVEERQPFATANEAADGHYTRLMDRQQVADVRRLLKRGVDNARKRLLRKADALRNDLQDAARADEYRVFGELLTANLHLVSRGATATVPNYYADNEPVSIPLDPTVGPAANAQRYFKRYSKLKTALTVVQEQLDKTMADVQWLEQAGVHLDMAETAAQLEEIAAELSAADLLPRNVRAALDPGPRGRAKARGRKARGQAPPPPAAAIVGDGVRVLIGGNGRQNDRLSLRIAKPDDIWLHAKDVAGAHVLLPREQPGLQGMEEPPEDVLRAAAAVAAYFSKARHGSNAAVDWTLAKNVRKPKGARPGMVIYDGHRTVYVTPDEKTIEQQLARARR